MKENNTIDYIKKGLGLIAGVGAAAITGATVKKVCPTADMGKIMKFCVGVGAAAFGGIASEKCSEYVENKVDETAKAVQEMSSEAPEVEVVEEEVVET